MLKIKQRYQDGDWLLSDGGMATGIEEKVEILSRILAVIVEVVERNDERLGEESDEMRKEAQGG